MNRQVPANKYLLIGRGRLATHLAFYFKILKVPFSQWSRTDESALLPPLVSGAERILLAIKDDALEDFIRDHSLPREKLIHFSASSKINGVLRLHPLMTFASRLYDLDDYISIPFIGDAGAPSLKDVIPELPNPFYQLQAGQHALYHALCVLSGNGTVTLWQNVFRRFAEELHLPPMVLQPYLERIFKNLLADPEHALTGPWARHDLRTIEKNRQALSGSPFLPVYNSLAETAERSSQ